jgi:cation diffusion facilitator family transporter
MKKDNEITPSSKKVIYRVSTVSIIFNVFLASFKLAAGIIGHSAAMVSDAVHSASDVAGTILVIIGAHLSSKAADKEHPYGHERFECVISILLADILAIVGIAIGYSGVMKIIDPSNIIVPTMLPLIAAVVSIVTKEALYWYTIISAKKINSVSLKAEAWHHRSDAFSSIGSFAGILGARMGYPVLDPVASIIIALFILKVAIDIFRETMDKMIDKTCDDDIVNELRQEVLSVDGVEHIDTLMTRQFGSKIYVDVEITMDGNLTLLEAHKTAEMVHHLLENKNQNIKHCMVHVNPDQETVH